jgi:hypothetical protein
MEWAWQTKAIKAVFYVVIIPKRGCIYLGNES